MLHDRMAERFDIEELTDILLQMKAQKKEEPGRFQAIIADGFRKLYL